jgi:hypothetical protein
MDGLKNERGQFTSPEDSISKLSRNDASITSGNDDDELLKNIKWLNMTSNVDTQQETETSECSIDIIIDKSDHMTEQQLV